MICTYLRSSSIGAYKLCNHSYFLNYVLGLPSDSNRKAELGTIYHAIAERLALIKLGQQQKKSSVMDEICGRLPTKKYNVDKIIQKCFDYYTKRSKHSFTKKDFDNISEWIERLLKDNIFCPLDREIFAVEQFFDIPIDQPWAKYKYKIGDTTIESNLAIKGTIDLITKLDDNTLEIIDYKTGARKDWATGAEKTYEYLTNDIQLCLYHYAIAHLYPQYDIVFTINFINDGGPFTIPFEKDTLPKTENRLKEIFLKINNQNIPDRNMGWHCSKFCHYGMNQHESGKTLCDHYHSELKTKGMEQVLIENLDISKINSYKAPGS